MRADDNPPKFFLLSGFPHPDLLNRRHIGQHFRSRHFHIFITGSQHPHRILRIGLLLRIIFTVGGIRRRKIHNLRHSGLIRHRTFHRTVRAAFIGDLYVRPRNRTACPFFYQTDLQFSCNSICSCLHHLIFRHNKNLIPYFIVAL